MKNLLRFKKAVERKSGLNNPLIEKIIAEVNFDKTLTPPYSKMVKSDDLYQNNENFKNFIDNLYKLTLKKVSVKDIKENIKDLQSLKKDLITANMVLVKTQDKFFKNERKALTATDSSELKTLDVFLKADKEQLKKEKEKEKELLLMIEHQYKKENGYF